ncbi:amidohydrolase family protein [Bacillus sp. EB600]|uniref:amidohydrolase family protein n=1 Tax=Bacillus sp. EB600 TaxID=2806345 RepID=UPI00210E79FF|nr:amidohydrolase family protein [Bacillus sp. EB600]MCQ6279939.1 amidohydrolase [Bacillus sp. EB600]
MIIDVHTHFVPEHLPHMADRNGGDLWPTLHCSCGGADHKHVMISGKSFRTITNQCWDPNRRMADMNDEDVDIQVLSPMPELLSYWFAAKDTLEFSRYINFQLSEFIAQNSNRFYGLGMLPMQDPELAAKEIKYMKNNFGLNGIEVGTNINGKSIGHPDFLPFFAEAEAEELVIFIHALHPFGSDRNVGPPMLANLIGFPNENAVAIASLITGGMLERFPNLKIYASHGGGSLSSILPRLNYGWETMEDMQKVIPKQPGYYAKKIFYDTLVYDLETVTHLSKVFGANQLMIGSDYPFSIREKFPGHWMDQLEISKEAKEQITFKNAMRFFQISSIKI